MNITENTSTFKLFYMVYWIPRPTGRREDTNPARATKFFAFISVDVCRKPTLYYRHFMAGKTAPNINCKLCRQVVPYLKIDTDSMIPFTRCSSSNSLSRSGRALISSLWVMGRRHNLWIISRLMKSSADTRPTPGMYRSPVGKRKVLELSGILRYSS